MKKIDSAHWKELSSLLDEVLELGGDARTVWLEGLGATRPEVAAEVQRLLAELQSLDAAGFLQGDPETQHTLRCVLHKLAGT
jgi:hypothetical protein